MCGRCTLIKLADFLHCFPWIAPPVQIPQPRYNIAPSQWVAAVVNDFQSHVYVDFLKWGLVPAWMKDHAPFAFAGLWDQWHDSAGHRVRSCTIITTTPNDVLKEVHDRMPAIVPVEAYQRWLSEDESPEEQIQKCLAPYPAELIEGFAVSPAVNGTALDSAEQVEPARETNDPQQHLFPNVH